MTGSVADYPALLEMRSIDKSFPGVQALKNVSLKLQRGEVLALLGENGAGKSTLIKVLGGAQPADAGEILIQGHPVQLHSPADARKAGISIIYQEFNLIPSLTVYENIFLGRETTRWGFTNSVHEKKYARALYARIGMRIDPETRCDELSVAQQQIVEIAKALSVEANIIVMDEPSATLTMEEVKHLFAIIRDLRKQGIGIIYISHRLQEIFEVADRILVLRDGRYAGESSIISITRDRLIEMMVGRTLDSEFPARTAIRGHERLRVENLTRADRVKNVSFALYAGEVLGFAGLVGAGRTETMRLIFGADPRDEGRIFVDDVEVDIRDPRSAIENRICLLTEDRKGQGLVLIHSCRENFGLPNLEKFSGRIFLDKSAERSRFANYIEELKIKIADPDQVAGNLSGGNQQKLVLAKWLQHNADIIIFDEPTRGIDVGARYEIYLLINELAAQGKAIVIVSSELPEILSMSDRIVVMHDGEIKGMIDNTANTSQEDILSMAIG
jgi:ABC-type sugar transport system ATPase subunit